MVFPCTMKRNSEGFCLHVHPCATMLRQKTVKGSPGSRRKNSSERDLRSWLSGPDPVPSSFSHDRHAQVRCSIGHAFKHPHVFRCAGSMPYEAHVRFQGADEQPRQHADQRIAVPVTPDPDLFLCCCFPCLSCCPALHFRIEKNHTPKEGRQSLWQKHKTPAAERLKSKRN